MSIYNYKVGGSLEYQHPTYTVRQADRELYEGLKSLEFCYVLNSRQMGKSSLRVQMMNRLQAEGINCVAIDLTLIGSDALTPENWYGGIAFELLSGFDLLSEVNFNTWWRDRKVLPPVQRLSLLIEEILLTHLSDNIVIFIDEIDSVKSLDFPTDDFFALIRGCYNRRVDHPHYKRMTFCLLGVATPSDLIEDKGRTPFNIGKAIELTGFTFDEAKLSLTPGLAEKIDNPELIIEAVLDWTGGQPFLTQKLCHIIYNHSKNTNKKSNTQQPHSLPHKQKQINKNQQPTIDNLVETHIINNWESQDEPEHLKTLRNRLLSNSQNTGRLLGIYQEILHKGEIIADDSPEQSQLRLTGLVCKQQGKLKIYNRIYQEVFNRYWVEKELSSLRPYTESFTAWITSNRQDESRLLRGRALQEALDWKTGKSLSVEDDDFLAASQQKELEAQREANKILADAKQKAEQLLEEAKAAKQQAEALLTQTKKLTQIERNDVKALRLFEVEGREIESLLLAMEVAQAWQKLTENQPNKTNFPSPAPSSTPSAAKPITSLTPSSTPSAAKHHLSLQKILEQIREKNQFTGHQGAVNSVSFSPNGKYIATASEDGTARLWNQEGNLEVELIGHQGKVRSISFSPNGEYIATASEDSTAILWDLSGNSITQFIGHQAWVGSVSFSPNGQYIATASEDGTAILWDLSGLAIPKTARFANCFAAAQAIAKFVGHHGRVLSVSFSPNSEYIATASEDGTAKLWNLSGNLIAEFIGHRGWVLSVSFSPNGEYIATAAADSTARLWDLSGKQVAQFLGHQGWVWHVTFSADGEYLATAAADSKARLWNLSGKQLAELKGHQGAVVSVSFSPDGKRLATASADGTARLWDLFKKQEMVFKGHTNWVLNVSFSPHGKYIATSSYDGTARLWDLAGNSIAELKGHQGWVASVNFSPDGNYLATSSEDGTAKLWDLSGKQIGEFKGHQGWVVSVTFSPDGNYLATASVDGTAKMWDLSGKQIVEFKGHRGKLASVNFSPNGEYLATAADDRSAILWNLAGNPITELIGHRGLIWVVCFSPNNQYLATASDDGTVGLWDLAGNRITELKGHQGGVLSVSFSPNSEYLATASADGTARLWDLSGEEVAQFIGHSDWVRGVTFSPDGAYLATASADTTARLWQIGDLGGGLTELLHRGCDWLQYYFASHPEALTKLQVCQGRR
ncbi:MAG TPA: hypothetical protein DEG17_20525 [Cyanobacteria bacterium UBA11149]|nr:hypothetical protein [Cyanobacteria bacterium UBA11367]HBE60536.1 hypothetical protein [Cyanobacteria bacterium UBA11366]HBK63532.1 hypothetical protein [Cyanobacteria bacterium UBA11166]HBR72574.1 hypothetical protein [Cyanobacteria bacterium UBA11159]HBS69263.1 hypothetical protein [Cyanobacteria bacterium UBA11153]HBW91181.1 hypothetical protein [Cyanobacteria bacterium UBA11149]HCA94765.1 hypothetical protein [Cyanobacteria bacterium UBA9226]